jgi:ABC-type Fe3+ transport system permease subunit
MYEREARYSEYSTLTGRGSRNKWSGTKIAIIVFVVIVAVLVVLAALAGLGVLIGFLIVNHRYPYHGVCHSYYYCV